MIASGFEALALGSKKAKNCPTLPGGWEEVGVEVRGLRNLFERPVFKESVLVEMVGLRRRYSFCCGHRLRLGISHKGQADY